MDIEKLFTRGYPMTLTELTISELDRLVRAVQATRPEDPAVVRQVVERMAADPTLRHGRMTIESVLNMLDAWNGSTVPPETQQPTVTAPVLDPADPYREARTLLGDDLITPEDIITAIGLPYTRAQLAIFSQSLPSAEILQWCSDHDYFLIAGPHVELSTGEVCDIFNDLFTENSGRQCDEWVQAQRQTVNVSRRWLGVGIRHRPLLQGKTFALQKKLLHPDCERVANAAETAWGIALAAKVRGIQPRAGGLRTQTQLRGDSTICFTCDDDTYDDDPPITAGLIGTGARITTLGLAVACIIPPPGQ